MTLPLQAQIVEIGMIEYQPVKPLCAFPLAAYYALRKRELLAEFEQQAQSWEQVMACHYGDDLAKTIVREAENEFEALLPALPYIGGDENHLTDELVRSARCLALYRAMKARGKTAEETGKVLYDAIEVQSRMPRPTRGRVERGGSDAQAQRAS